MTGYSALAFFLLSMNLGCLLGGIQLYNLFPPSETDIPIGRGAYGVRDLSVSILRVPLY